MTWNNEDEKWAWINSLDEELLVGGIIISEWSSYLVRDADIAFVSGAYLACILTAMAGVECHLRYENTGDKKMKLYELIEAAPIDEDLRTDLQTLRKYRNSWVHVDDPHSDDELLEYPENAEREIEKMAKKAVVALRKVIYMEQCV